MSKHQSNTPHPLEVFTGRERDILELVTEGLTNRAISQQLHLSEDTVKWYNRRIFEKLEVSSRTQAANKVRELKLFSQPIPSPALRNIHKFPTYLTTFIGREPEIESIKNLLHQHRLVTVTGVGGAGKTRLVCEVGRNMAESFKVGVHFVSLATVSDVNRVVTTINQSLDCNVSLGKTSEDILVNFLDKKDMLLILDNFEHVIEENDLITYILKHTKKVRLLVTSRERLRLDKEKEFALSPMRLPQDKMLEDIDLIMQSEAVTFFINRVQGRQPNLELSDDDIRGIGEICVRLDGLPLALELAAARHKVLSLRDILNLLENRFELLTSGARNLPNRQQTLRAAIDWSYDLLNEDEQFVFATLSVFRGGCRWEAILAVCQDDTKTIAIEDIIPSLVDKRLIEINEGFDGELRYSMLETLREYGLEQLSTQGLLSTTQQRYCEYILEYTDNAWDSYHNGRDQELWSRKIETDLDNIREAMLLSINNKAFERADLLYRKTALWWVIFQKLTEGYQWTERILKLKHHLTPNGKAKTLLKAGHIFIRCGERQRAENALQESVEIFQEINNERFYAWALLHLSRVINSIEKTETALAIFEKLDDLPGQFTALISLGEHYHLLEAYAQAQAYYERGLEKVLQHDIPSMEVTFTTDLAQVRFQQKDYQQARSGFHRALALAEQINSPQTCVEALVGLVSIAIVDDNFDGAAQLFGFIETWRKENGSEFDLIEQRALEQAQLTLQQNLSSIHYNTLIDVGGQMTLDEAIVFVQRSIS